MKFIFFLLEILFTSVLFYFDIFHKVSTALVVAICTTNIAFVRLDYGLYLSVRESEGDYDIKCINQ